MGRKAWAGCFWYAMNGWMDGTVVIEVDRALGMRERGVGERGGSEMLNEERG